MLRQRLCEQYPNSKYYGTPKIHNLKGEAPIFLTEQRIAFYGLILSLVVITEKLFEIYKEDISKFILEQKLISYEVLTDDGNEMIMHSWKTAVKYSNIWLPIMFGILSSYFTWMMVYIDSQEPGIQPPSPFSPKKYKLQSGHNFHLNYIFALIIGFLVFFYMYLKNVSIEY